MYSVNGDFVQCSADNIPTVKVNSDIAPGVIPPLPQSHLVGPPDCSKVLAQLQATVSQLAQEVTHLTNASSRQPAIRASSSRPLARGPPPNQKGAEEVLCWYHYRFGDEARNCEKGPCAYAGNDNRGGRHL